MNQSYRTSQDYRQSSKL